MIQREAVAKAKEDGKRVVLRIDNMPKNSRNRNTASSRIRAFADLADLVIYQSNWAKEYVSYFTKKDGPVIYNGVDTNIYKPDGPVWGKDDNKTIYMYSRFNRDESKRPHEAFYYYHMYWRDNPDSELWIMGQFGRDSQTYNFDFFMDEPVQYFGCMDNPEQIAMYYRAADYLLVPYFNDACSNTVIEAMCCGCKIDTCLSGATGGTNELLWRNDTNFDWSAKRMVEEYINEFKKIL